MNVPNLHRLGGQCQLCSAHAKAAERHTAQPHVRTRRYLPWAAPFVAGALLLPFFGEGARWMFLGLAIGVGTGAGLAWLTHLLHRHIAAATLASATEELKMESEQRVGMVIRQFEWAVNDVANLRDALKRAQEGRTAAEANEQRVRRRVRQLERQLYEARLTIGEYSNALGGKSAAVVEEPALLPSNEDLVVPLTWRVTEENMLTWLKFESAGIVPSQIRIVNEHESVVAISARALETVDEGTQVSLVVRAPEDVVATLEGRQQGRFTFEALVDDTWCKVELKAAESRKPAPKQKRDRKWSPSDDQRRQSLIA